MPRKKTEDTKEDPKPEVAPFAEKKTSRKKIEYKFEKPWEVTKLEHLTFSQFVTTPLIPKQRRPHGDKKVMDHLIQKYTNKKALLAVVLAELLDGRKFGVDCQNRQIAAKDFFQTLDEAAQKDVEANFLQAAQTYKVSGIKEAQDLFAEINTFRVPLTQAEINQVALYPQIKGYEDFLEELKRTSYFELLKECHSEKEVNRLDPERAIEHVFALTNFEKMMETKAVYDKCKSRTFDGIYERILRSAKDMAALVGDEGVDRTKRAYKGIAKKILLFGTAALSHARIGADRKNWKEKTQLLVHDFLRRDHGAKSATAHIHSVMRKNGITQVSSGSAHQRQFFEMFQEVVTGKIHK